MDTPPSCGILFAATGDEYKKEAIAAAASYRKHMPDVPLALATRGDLKQRKPFDLIIDLGQGVDSYTDKISALRKTPFARTLFVDTDTRCGSVPLIVES